MTKEELNYYHYVTNRNIVQDCRLRVYLVNVSSHLKQLEMVHLGSRAAVFDIANER